MGSYRVLDRLADGDSVESGAAVLRVEADTQGLLTAERTMLNLVCHLSGIASATRQWVDAVAGTRADRPRHPQDAARVCGRCRNTRCGSAGDRTTGWDWAMPR